MNVLGISCYFHDSAAALVQNGRIIAAVSEERFSRIKHDAEFPVQAVRYCLQQGHLLIDDIDTIVFYDKPFRKFDRILTTYLAVFPKSLKPFVKAVPVWLKQKLRPQETIYYKLHYRGKVLYCDHHLSHAASAFLPSPFRRAAIMTFDGVGEWDTATTGIGEGTRITLNHEIRYPHSLGLLYNAFTYYLGFQVNSDEYKVMGLAPYGKTRYVDTIHRLIDIKPDGSFNLDMRYFGYHYGLRMTNSRFHRLFGGRPRTPESPIEQKHMDLAASIQAVTEEVVLNAANHLQRTTGLKNLCLSGGVALNSVANGRLLRETLFEDIFIQPAAGDAGGAVGAALFACHTLMWQPRTAALKHVYLGPEYPDEEIERFLRNQNIPFQYHKLHDLVAMIADKIAHGKVIGWFQGRMEFGPRALGNRSILADARRPEMKDVVNAKIKFREGFRPFAPAVLADQAHRYFDLDRPSPFMLLVVPVRPEKRADIPAVTHEDGSARVQTVTREQNPLFYDLIDTFGRQTGCPVLLNTSFNVRGEPIVRSPREAWNCFQKSGLDLLVMGSYVVDKDTG